MAKGPRWSEEELQLLLELDAKTTIPFEEVVEIVNNTFQNNRSGNSCYLQLRLAKVRKEIEDTIQEMLEDKTIGEGDIVAVRTILYYMSLGRDEANKISSQYVRNLEENGFTEDGKLVKGDDDFATWFCLAVAGAQGYITQCVTEEEAV